MSKLKLDIEKDVDSGISQQAHKVGFITSVENLKLPDDFSKDDKRPRISNTSRSTRKV